MPVITNYCRKLCVRDIHCDNATHQVAVDSETSVTGHGLGTVFLRLDGAGDTGTGDWETSGNIIAASFSDAGSGTSSLYKLELGASLVVVTASKFEVTGSAFTVGIPSTFSDSVDLQGGAEAATLLVGSTIPAGSEKLRAESARVTTLACGGTMSAAGAVTLASTLSVAGSSTLAAITVSGTAGFSGLATFNAGLTVPSGQTMLIASGATLDIDGSLAMTTLTASEVQVASASGSEKLRTTTFRATGSAVFGNNVTVSGTILGTAYEVTSSLQVDSGASFTVLGVPNYWDLPASSDTTTGASLDLDNLATPNSHHFNPSGANRTISSVSASVTAVLWFYNTSATYKVTLAAGLMANGSAWDLNAGATALIRYDKATGKFTVVAN